MLESRVKEWRPNPELALIEERAVDATHICCPVCRQERSVEKVSGVVRRARGLVLENGDVGVRMYMSELARLLAFPDQPRATPWSRTIARCLVSVIVGGVIFAIIRGLAAQDLVDIPSGPLDAALIANVSWFVLLVPLFLLGRTFLEQRQARLDTPDWLRARAIWERLYYCKRDDVVFKEGEATVYSPEAMSELFVFTAAEAVDTPVTEEVSR